MCSAPTAPAADTFSQRLAAMLGGKPEAQPTAAQPEPAPTPAPQTAPVGSGEYVVKNGECFSSIARQTGHFWETLWNDPGNCELRAVRLNPNVILPEDRVFVPPLRPKLESGQTEMRHRFVRRGEPSKLRMVIKANGRPRANEPYTLEIDGKVFQGTLDPEGKLERAIPGDAKSGKLIVGEGPDAKEYRLKLGGLAPIDATMGLQARLRNLGFGPSRCSGEMDEETQAAMRRFQAKYGLPETGAADRATLEKVKEIHGF